MINRMIETGAAYLVCKMYNGSSVVSQLQITDRYTLSVVLCIEHLLLYTTLFHHHNMVAFIALLVNDVIWRNTLSGHYPQVGPVSTYIVHDFAATTWPRNGPVSEKSTVFLEILRNFAIFLNFFTASSQYFYISRVRHRRGEMYVGHGRLCVCVSVCLSLAAFLHYCIDVHWRKLEEW